jgi:hypothetical protein
MSDDPWVSPVHTTSADENEAYASHPLHAEVAALTAERDRLREEVADWDRVDELRHRIHTTITAELDKSTSDLVRKRNQLIEERDEAIAERDRLREHILDIDAHATPYGDIPDEPGWVGTYLLTAGALHRALGKIGHTAPSCRAEAERNTLAAQLAQAETVIEKVGVWLDDDFEESYDKMRAAVDAYQATPATTEREGAGDVVGD